MQQKKEDIGGIDGDSSNVLFELRKTFGNGGKDEREITTFYVGTLPERSSKSGIDGVCPCVEGSFFSDRKQLLSAGAGVDGICVFPHVFPQYCEAVGGESVVSRQRDESQKMVSEP